MKLFIEKQNKKTEMKFNGSVKELLLKLKINSETVIVVKGKELVSEDEKLDDNDDVRILSVISGG